MNGQVLDDTCILGCDIVVTTQKTSNSAVTTVRT